MESDGTVLAAKSLGITTANVTRAAAGAYCFSGLPFTIRSAMANPVNVNVPLGARVLPVTSTKEGASPCAFGQTRVETFNTTNNVETDSAFIVWFEE